MEQETEILQVSRLFKVLADKTRLKILLALKKGELNVTTIGEVVEMEQSAVSHQLKLLRDNRVVKSRREGKTVLYSLDAVSYTHLTLPTNSRE